MKKILISGMAAFILSLTNPCAVYAEEQMEGQTEAGTELSIQAIAVTEDIPVSYTHIQDPGNKAKIVFRLLLAKKNEQEGTRHLSLSSTSQNQPDRHIHRIQTSA